MPKITDNKRPPYWLNFQILPWSPTAHAQYTCRVLVCPYRQWFWTYRCCPRYCRFFSFSRNPSYRLGQGYRWLDLDFFIWFLVFRRVFLSSRRVSFGLFFRLLLIGAVLINFYSWIVWAYAWTNWGLVLDLVEIVYSVGHFNGFSINGRGRTFLCFGLVLSWARSFLTFF